MVNLNKIETGLVAVEITGILNCDKIVEELGEKTANVATCKNSKDKQALTETIKKYKEIRTPLKKTRASVVKEIKAKTKEILGEFDTVIGLVSDYIEPYQTVVDEYDEKNRIAKIEKLKKETAQRISEVNQYIEDMNDTIGYKIADAIVFGDWAKNTKVAFEHIDACYRNAEYSYKRIKDTVFAVKMITKKLKNEYDLATDLNCKLILGDKLFTEDLEVIEKILDEFAAEQQITELEATEKATELLQRKNVVSAKNEITYVYRITSKKAIDIDNIMEIDGVVGVELL